MSCFARENDCPVPQPYTEGPHMNGYAGRFLTFFFIDDDSLCVFLGVRVRRAYKGFSCLEHSPTLKGPKVETNVVLVLDVKFRLPWPRPIVSTIPKIQRCHLTPHTHIYIHHTFTTVIRAPLIKNIEIRNPGSFFADTLENSRRKRCSVKKNK